MGNPNHIVGPVPPGRTYKVTGVNEPREINEDGTVGIAVSVDYGPPLILLFEPIGEESGWVRFRQFLAIMGGGKSEAIGEAIAGLTSLASPVPRNARTRRAIIQYLEGEEEGDVPVRGTGKPSRHGPLPMDRP